MKTICMFCLKSHKTKKPAPMLCQIKGGLMDYYSSQLEVWQVMAGIEKHGLPFNDLAQAIVKRVNLETRRYQKRMRGMK